MNTSERANQTAGKTPILLLSPANLAHNPVLNIKV